MIIWLYRVLTSLLYYLINPFARYRISKGDVFWKGRIGMIEPVRAGSVWIHSASAGEARVASYLAHYLRRKNADQVLVGSVQTRTGFEMAEKICPEGMLITGFPLDSPQAVRNALSVVRPTVIVITETEIWFNFLLGAFRSNIPVVLVNGRMTERAFGRYRKIRGTLSSLLKNYDRLFCKSEEDAARYVALGARPDRVQVVGDMKFDAPLPQRSMGRIAEIRSRLGVSDTDFLLVAGSTRPGEELMLVEGLKAVKARYKKLRILIAPRHVQRAEEVVSICESAGYRVSRYGVVSPGADILVVDRFGLLEQLYMAANIAFVGGSLVELGGHNVLEPVWNGTPVVFGPSISNIEEAVEYVLRNKYGRMVETVNELADLVNGMIEGSFNFETLSERSMANTPTEVAGEHIRGLIESA